MSEQKTGLVPRLRFPEFREAGEWETKRVGEICDILQGYGFPEALQGRSEGTYPFCKVSDISMAVSEFGGLLSTAANYVSEEDISNLRAKLVPKYSTVFAKIGEALRLNRRAITTRECLIDNNVVGLKGKPKKVGDYFLYLLSQTVDLGEYCGGAVPSVNKSILSEIPLWITGEAEQQKVASCLSALDALIAAHADKLDALKTHKKGLMQQLFPREGETVPRLRFPEFREAGEWIDATLGDVADVASGGTPNRSKSDYWDGEIPWVSTSLIDFASIERANEYITHLGLENSAAKIFPKGTVLMAMYGQGKTRGKVAILGINAAINQACAALSAADKVLSEFVFQNLAGRYDEIRKISNAGGQENLSGTLIKNISFKYPDIGSGEQQKIAACLSSLDALITAQTEKLDALKTHKKGLMQQLFPSPEA
ncbi:restriction endonuclease subunit S [Lamprobacter modestohalophilus]|uniref:restriction endonuclease subunit S n=1 Tax=Lamprobacter modestohalophilus TaxID=1064514 RepID=UPI002ADEE159|nr:restriction endonuclease subunit S [Lamprobacter modestohalophilus]MEA1052261.1 restriction endonuclease subunit S [Lamprobacter modestohalophilus]